MRPDSVTILLLVATMAVVTLTVMLYRATRRSTVITPAEIVETSPYLLLKLPADLEPMAPIDVRALREATTSELMDAVASMQRADPVDPRMVRAKLAFLYASHLLVEPRFRGGTKP